jgi:two-component system response regulator GlrR
MPLIAVIDDDPHLVQLLKAILKKEGHEVEGFHDGSSFLEHLDLPFQSYDLVLSDFRLPDIDGLALFQQSRRKGLQSPFLIMTAYGNFDVAVQALKAGVADYLIKPLKRELLVRKVASYMERKALEEEVLADRLEKQIVAESGVMRAIVSKLSRLGRSNASILFTGDSGTGKEVLARMLHSISARQDKKFIAVNVSAIPETLFESEFFGYKKGAFTDAVRDHEGHAREADGGTLFLDEIGDLPASSQAKLLRLLEERQVQPIGSKEVHAVDFRLISATNRNLKQLIRSRRFRKDLFYRIAVVSIRIPALHERPGDIVPLARHLLRQLSEEEDLKVIDFTPEAQQALVSYNWPGNVRELRNRVHEALLATDEPWVDGHHLALPDPAGRAAETVLSYERARARFRKKYITRLLRATHGNINRAAEQSGLSRKAIYDMLRATEIAARSFRRRRPV